MAMIRAKARTSPNRSYNNVRLLCPMPPLQVNAHESRPSFGSTLKLKERLLLARPFDPSDGLQRDL